MKHAIFWLVLVSLMAAPHLAWSAAKPLGYSIGIPFMVTGYSERQPFARASGIYFDPAREEIYVADTGNHQVVIFDRKGIPLYRFQHYLPEDASTGKRRPGEPRAVVTLKTGEILVADNLCAFIDVLDYQGHSVQRFWPAELLQLEKDAVQPRCLALDAGGQIYLSVSGKLNAILVLTPDFRLKTLIDRDGSGERLRTVTGLWVDRSGTIYATFAQGTCVRIFTPDGAQLTSFGEHDTGPQNFSLPSGIITDAHDQAWVVDSLRHVVTAFTRDSLGAMQYIDMIGGYGGKAGQFAFPTAISGDGKTRFYVLENNGARLQAFELQFTDEL